MLSKTSKKIKSGNKKLTVKKPRRINILNKQNKNICEVFFVRHGLTENNVNGIGYDNYTPEEYYPLLPLGRELSFKTGGYFNKYGKFDIAFVSPRHRCIQTFEEINKSLNIPRDKVFITDQLLEGRQGITNLLPNTERNQLQAKIKAENQKWQELEARIAKETNEFRKMELNDELEEIINEALGKSDRNKVDEKFRKFLKQLEIDIRKNGYKRILCVAHSGTVVGIQKILQSRHYCHMLDYEKGKKEFVHQASNAWMAARYLKKEKRYEIVIPTNNMQLA